MSIREATQPGRRLEKSQCVCDPLSEKIIGGIALVPRATEQARVAIDGVAIF